MDRVDETLVYEGSLPAEPASVGTLRRELAGALEPLEIGPDRLADIALVVSEALTNAAMHAYVSMTPGSMTLVAAVSNGNLRVTVTDEGRGMVPRTDSPGLGLGLGVMSRVADALEISSPGGRGTEVSLSFPLQAPSARSGPSRSRAARAARRAAAATGRPRRRPSRRPSG